MSRIPVRLLFCLGAPCIAGGCAGHASPSAGLSAGMASRGAAAGADTLDVAYHGVGGAMEAPLRDFNLMRAQIPPVLTRAAQSPYGAADLTSCAALAREVAALDLALGPDLDTPDLENGADMYARGAGLAADAALDAMRSAAVGYIPMRSVVRRLSGADKLERAAKRAVLAGSVRRGFLKALGMQRRCGWPAAPLGSEAAPAEVIATAPSGPGLESGVAAFAPAPPAALTPTSLISAPISAPIPASIASPVQAPTPPPTVAAATVAPRGPAPAPGGLAFAGGVAGRR